MHVTRSQLSEFTSFFEPQIIFFKALVADVHNMQPVFPCQLAEDDGIHFNGLYIFAAHQKAHVFKTLERIGQNVLLHILLSIATLFGRYCWAFPQSSHAPYGLHKSQ